MLEEAASEHCSVLSLRAGVVVGAGSTSFEVIRQLATLLLVQPVPSWLEHQVQPIAVSDVLRAMVEAFADDHLTGAVDIGGPNVLPYSRSSPSAPAPPGCCASGCPPSRCPAPLVSLGTAAMVAAPFWTVNALIESLRHEMVCRPGETWVPKDGAAAARRPRGDGALASAPPAAAPRRRCPATPTGPGCAPRSSTSCTPRRRSAPAPAWRCGGCAVAAAGPVSQSEL